MTSKATKKMKKDNLDAMLPRYEVGMYFRAAMGYPMDQKSMDWKLSAVWITLSLGYVKIRLASGKWDGRWGLTS